MITFPERSVASEGSLTRPSSRAGKNRFLGALSHILRIQKMPSGDKSAYTDKQKRQAKHIEEGYEERGLPESEAERRAWATVNKQDGGGKKTGPKRRPKQK